MKYPLHVTSEIGELKTVILHRPGREVENLTPEYLQRLLFDDIPFLPAIQKEHDYFASALRNRGVEVLYLETLVEESLHTDELREQFVDQILEESKSNINGARQNLKDYLLKGSTKELVEKVMAGVLKTEIEQDKKVHLYELMADHYPFYLDPMPNLYFTRDPAAVIGGGISINKMNESARVRESIFMDYIMNHHPRFATQDIPKWITRDSQFSMEGGDQLVLNKHTVAVGVSARSTAQAIEKMAINLFEQQKDITKVIAVEIPKSRAFMHLDTVFTMVDYNKFTIHPAIQGPEGNMRIFILEKGEEKRRVKIQERNNLAETLKEVLGLDEIVLIPCGGGDPIASAREQWNDGSNTLAIAPGVVMTYDRNYVSNDLLRQHGLEVIEIPSSELSRGRGGPRCMSMPIYREDI
ncbi:arginine deiminase [Bacillus sp. FJAT-47783]|uniref:arginine deiminase n=1 Tax=Bacillus sp. FJAT-47783 TaxID=2922712 RepID=UPI001FAB6E15|nr:arginine deiminase [Bacillus sp. FJAT-47783]